MGEMGPSCLGPTQQQGNSLYVLSLLLLLLMKPCTPLCTPFPLPSSYKNENSHDWSGGSSSLGDPSWSEGPDFGQRTEALRSPSTGLCTCPWPSHVTQQDQFWLSTHSLATALLPGPRDLIPSAVSLAPGPFHSPGCDPSAACGTWTEQSCNFP
jgi:hypothetical protein